MSLQEAVQRAEDGGEEDDAQRQRTSSGQERVDQTPAEGEGSTSQFHEKKNSFYQKKFQFQ